MKIAPHSRRIWISGHRGTRIHAIENTAAAFQYALDHQIDYIEFDVKKTSDEEIVVFHDSRINRLLNGTGAIEALSLTQLRKYTYADGQKIQTLEEFFTQIQKNVRPMLEIKSRKIGAKIMKLVHDFGYKNEEILIQSFRGQDIMECYEINPNYDYGLCMAVLGKAPFFRKQIASYIYRKFVQPFPVKWLNLDGPFIYDEFIQEAQSHGKNIILGAKNTSEYLPQLDTWGIEIVNADDPVQIRKEVQDLGYKVISN